MTVVTETWSTIGNIIFVNTYDTTSVDLQYVSSIHTAESAIGSSWTTSSPFTLTFDFVSGGTTRGSNTPYSYIPATYSQLTGKLPSSDTLPPDDPASGATWYLPEAYARMLGLSTFAPPMSSFDDQINLATGLSGSDQVSILEHEITEGGMGRIGGLGGKTYTTLSGTSQSNIWGAPDLFRYSNGAYDSKANDTTFFSANGGSTISSFAFFSGTNSHGYDTADFESDATGNFGASDVFGVGAATFSETDYLMMDALGWKPILPDLEIDSLTVTNATVALGTGFSYSTTIGNHGIAAAGSFDTQIYFSNHSRSIVFARMFALCFEDGHPPDPALQR